MSLLTSSLVQPGDILVGKYRVERVLGAGAMGEVVRARHIELNSLVAIKLMLPSLNAHGDSAARFKKEAQAAMLLKSAHAVKVYDFGNHNGAPFIVMEHLEGQDLSKVVEARGALPIGEAVKYVRQVCDALGEAHHAGITHRDLKPANMFLEAYGDKKSRVKILDFGIAKVPNLDDPRYVMHATATGMVMGTPLYMSPEQMSSSRSADPRSDIWSLGVILYNFITGTHPFEAETLQLLCAAILRDAPAPPSSRRPDIPPEIEQIIMRCLERDPRRRFQTVEELDVALAPFESYTAPPSPTRRVAGGGTEVMSHVLAPHPPEAKTLTQKRENPLKVEMEAPWAAPLADRRADAPSAQNGQRSNRTALWAAIAGMLALVAGVVLVVVWFVRPTAPQPQAPEVNSASQQAPPVPRGNPTEMPPTPTTSPSVMAPLPSHSPSAVPAPIISPPPGPNTPRPSPSVAPAPTSAPAPSVTSGPAPISPAPTKTVEAPNSTSTSKPLVPAPGPTKPALPGGTPEG